jgi:hypothetical protein
MNHWLYLYQTGTDKPLMYPWQRDYLLHHEGIGRPTSTPLYRQLVCLYDMILYHTCLGTVFLLSSICWF